MKTFNCGAARVTYKKAMNSQGGVMEVAYYGPVSNDAFAYLRRAVSELVSDAPALVIRMDSALCLIDKTPCLPPSSYLGKCPPAAMIVRRETYAIWSEFGRRIAAQGFKRAVFCDSQAALAYLWAEDHACLGRELLPL